MFTIPGSVHPLRPGADKPRVSKRRQEHERRLKALNGLGRCKGACLRQPLSQDILSPKIIILHLENNYAINYNSTMKTGATICQAAEELDITAARVGQLIAADQTLAKFDEAIGRYIIPRSSIERMRRRNMKPGPQRGK